MVDADHWLMDVNATGTGARLSEGVAKVFNGSVDADELEASIVQPYYTRSLARNLDASLSISNDFSESFTFSFRAPRKS